MTPVSPEHHDHVFYDSSKRSDNEDQAAPETEDEALYGEETGRSADTGSSSVPERGSDTQDASFEEANMVDAEPAATSGAAAETGAELETSIEDLRSELQQVADEAKALERRGNSVVDQRTNPINPDTGQPYTNEELHAQKEKRIRELEAEIADKEQGIPTAAEAAEKRASGEWEAPRRATAFGEEDMLAPDARSEESASDEAEGIVTPPGVDISDERRREREEAAGSEEEEPEQVESSTYQAQIESQPSAAETAEAPSSLEDVTDPTELAQFLAQQEALTDENGDHIMTGEEASRRLRRAADFYSRMQTAEPRGRHSLRGQFNTELRKLPQNAQEGNIHAAARSLIKAYPNAFEEQSSADASEMDDADTAASGAETTEESVSDTEPATEEGGNEGSDADTGIEGAPEEETQNGESDTKAGAEEADTTDQNEDEVQGEPRAETANETGSETASDDGEETEESGTEAGTGSFEYVNQEAVAGEDVTIPDGQHFEVKAAADATITVPENAKLTITEGASDLTVITHGGEVELPEGRTNVKVLDETGEQAPFTKAEATEPGATPEDEPSTNEREGEPDETHEQEGATGATESTKDDFDEWLDRNANATEVRPDQAPGSTESAETRESIEDQEIHAADWVFVDGGEGNEQGPVKVNFINEDRTEAELEGGLTESLDNLRRARVNEVFDPVERSIYAQHLEQDGRHLPNEEMSSQEVRAQREQEANQVAETINESVDDYPIEQQMQEQLLFEFAQWDAEPPGGEAEGQQERGKQKPRTLEDADHYRLRPGDFAESPLFDTPREILDFSEDGEKVYIKQERGAEPLVLDRKDVWPTNERRRQMDEALATMESERGTPRDREPTEELDEEESREQREQAENFLKKKAEQAYERIGEKLNAGKEKIQKMGSRFGAVLTGSAAGTMLGYAALRAMNYRPLVMLGGKFSAVAAGGDADSMPDMGDTGTVDATISNEEMNTEELDETSRETLQGIYGYEMNTYNDWSALEEIENLQLNTQEDWESFRQLMGSHIESTEDVQQLAREVADLQEELRTGEIDYDNNYFLQHYLSNIENGEIDGDMTHSMGGRVRALQFAEEAGVDIAASTGSGGAAAQSAEVTDSIGGVPTEVSIGGYHFNVPFSYYSDAEQRLVTEATHS